MHQAAGDFAIEITNLANQTYDTCDIPERMKESGFIVIPEKEGAVECGKHRTSSIVSQVAKIVLRVTDERLKRKTEETVDRTQFCFSKSKVTGNAIFVVRAYIERVIEKQKDLFKCFVDFDKAFDVVRHEVLVERLRSLGVDTADIRVMTNLYWGQRAVVKIEDGKNDWIDIERSETRLCGVTEFVLTLLTGHHGRNGRYGRYKGRRIEHK